MAHLAHVIESWRSLSKDNSGEKVIALNGSDLAVADLILICRKSAKVSLDPSAGLEDRMMKSIKTLEQHLNRGEVVYGVTTGFGGNADTRTQSLEKLQSSSLQHHQCAVATDGTGFAGYSKETESLPRDVAKALMVIRCNSLLRGHSAIRLEIIELLLDAVNQDLVPLIPRRGSISASGDLCPLSYVGGLLEGNPDIYVSKKNADGSITIMSADKAIKILGRPAVKLRAKEGLAILNGTAASTALASFVLYDSHNLAVLSQIITAMAMEALRGNRNNFDPFISNVRPHAGQSEAAANIRRFINESKLCSGHEANITGLAQDGYSLRTSAQWIGPQLEDLLSARQQVEVELNSTTDNPLIDVAGNCFHHGGNFQAASITSAMEKTRTAMVMLGRLILAQCNEIINPVLNKGLPPNLCFDDPSISFTMKGVDVNMTAYFSELAYLANSVASHVQTADIGNQPVNSLALISARYTAQSVEILSLMCSAALYELCQALDIRALYADFFRLAQDRLRGTYMEILKDNAVSEHLHVQVFEYAWPWIVNAWDETTRLDLTDRCKAVASKSVNHILEVYNELGHVTTSSAISWKTKVASVLETSYIEVKTKFLKAHTTEEYLSGTTKTMYNLIRKELGIPLHLGVEDHPALAEEESDHSKAPTNGNLHHSVAHEGKATNGTLDGIVNEVVPETANEAADGTADVDSNMVTNGSATGHTNGATNGGANGVAGPPHKKTIGSHIGTIFQALSNGVVMESMLKTLQQKTVPVNDSNGH